MSVSTAVPAKPSPTTRMPDFLRKIAVDPWLFGVFVLVTLSVLIFAVMPVFAVLKQAIFTSEGFDFSALIDTLTQSYIWRSFFNTIFLGAVSALIATSVGFVLAFSTTRTTMPGKRLVIILFGRSGFITRELLGIRNANAYGFHSLVLIQSLAFTPIAYLNIRGMLQSIDSALEDASASLGASRWTTFRRVTLPLVVPAILSSALLVFVKSIEDFGNPMLIGGNYQTLAVEAYSQMIGYFNMNGGAMLASLMLVPSMTAFLIHRYWVSRRSYVTVTGKPSVQTIRLSGRSVVPLALVSYFLVFAILLFYLTVVYVSFNRLPGVDRTLTIVHYAYVFNAGFQTLGNSLILASISTPVITLIGMMIAFLLIRKAFPCTFLLRWGTLLSFAAPGTIIGIGYISSFNTESSAILGASNARTFLKITLPLLKPALFTSVAYAFTRSLTTLSAIIFLVSANWTLITVTILSQVETQKIGIAAAYCCILIVVVLVILAIMQLLLSSSSTRR